MKTVKFIFLVLSAALAMAFFLSCAHLESEKQENRYEKSMAWPARASSEKITFLRSFSSPADLGIKRKFTQKIKDFLVGQDESKMVRPTAVYVSAGGMIFVADPGVEGIHLFDPKRNRYAVIKRDRGAPLPSPVGLTGAGKDEIYVVDSALKRAYRVDVDKAIAQPLKLDALFERPVGIVCDSEAGKIYVLDAALHTVKVFGSDGKFIFAFGGNGSRDGEFNYPASIWRTDSGDLVVSDSLNFRVQIFGGDGVFKSKFGKIGDATGYLSRPKGIASDRLGHLYLVDSLFHAVQIFDASGAFLLTFGSHGRDPGAFWLPIGIFVGEDNTIYVADSGNSRVQIFRYEEGAMQ